MRYRNDSSSFAIWFDTSTSTPIRRSSLYKGANSSKVTFMPQKERLLAPFAPEIDRE